MRRTLALLLMATAVPMWAAQPVRARTAWWSPANGTPPKSASRFSNPAATPLTPRSRWDFALAVTHPSAGNIGGGGFMLIRLADGRTTFIDFRERAPLAPRATCTWTPPGKPRTDSLTAIARSGVPGTVRGLEYAHKKYGKKPWAECWRPAVELPRRAFPSPTRWRNRCARTAQAWPQFPGFQAHLPERRQLLRAGEVFATRAGAARSSASRRTARRISTKARPRSAARRGHGGARRADHARRSARITRPSSASRSPANIADTTSITSPPPSSGGVGILQMLGMLEGTGYEKTGAGSAARPLLAEAMRRFFADRSEYLGDPDFVKVPLTSPARPGLHSASCARPSIRIAPRPAAEVHAAAIRPGTNPTRPRTTRWSMREGNVGRGDLHAERRLSAAR